MQYLHCLLTSFLCYCLIGCTYAPNELNKAEQLMETSPDSALKVLKQINRNRLFTPSNKALYALLMSQALDKNDIKVESDSLIQIATKYYSSDEAQRAAYAWFYAARVANNSNNAKTQADALFKAQEYADKTDNIRLKGLVYGDKGSMYKTQGKCDSAICYFKRSNQSFLKTDDKRNYIINLLNIGTEYLKLSRFDSVISNYLLAAKAAKSIHDTLLISGVYRALGSLYLKQKAYQQAVYYYNKVPVTKEELYNSNKWFLQANVYVRTGDTDSARYCLHKVKMLLDMAPNYYMLWQQIYEKEGKLRRALIFASKATNAFDSLYNNKLDVSFAGLEKKYKYQSLQIANQQLIIKKKKNDIILLLMLLILSTIMMIGLFWRIKVKKQQFETQQLLLKQEHALVENEKENSALLSKQLKFQSILLLNIEQHRENSIKRPGIWKNNSKQSIAEQNTTFYQELIACMDLEFNNISDRLLNTYEKLTQRDILMCCLLLASFDSGMIATILDVKNDSIIKHRHRLRKKLDLSNSDNLLDFLRQF